MGVFPPGLLLWEDVSLHPLVCLSNFGGSGMPYDSVGPKRVDDFAFLAFFL